MGTPSQEKKKAILVSVLVLSLQLWPCPGPVTGLCVEEEDKE